MIIVGGGAELRCMGDKELLAVFKSMISYPEILAFPMPEPRQDFWRLLKTARDRVVQ